MQKKRHNILTNIMESIMIHNYVYEKLFYHKLPDASANASHSKTDQKMMIKNVTFEKHKFRK